MLKPQQTQSIKTLFPLQTPFLHGNGGHAFLLQVQLRPSFNKPPKVRVGFSSANNIKAVATTPATEKSLNVKAVVTVKGLTAKDREDIQDTGKSLLLELVSAQLDPITGSEKATVKGYANKTGIDKVGNMTYDSYEAAFEVPVDFGQVGAILVENEHHKELFLTDVVLDGFPNGPITISCDSWVQSKRDKRVFFTNKSYLPSQTPNGLKRLRGEELNKLQGNGEGERQTGDRIYDYDVYNDIGDPDSTTSLDLKRPVLGGKEHPYPRRCRTGRPRCEKDPSSEKRSSLFYVPRDEEFSEVKQQGFNAKSFYSGVHALPTVGKAIGDSNVFQDFTDIDLLFYEAGVPPPTETEQGFLKKSVYWIGRVVRDIVNRAVHFTTPDTIKRDKFFWLRDEEFARQTLAGLNPHSLQLVTEWPLKSTLEPETYGTPGSATENIEGMTVEEQKLTEIIEEEIKGFMTVKEQKLMEIIEGEIKGFMIVKEAIEQKKLFMLDYHDLLLPYVGNVRKLEGTTPLILNGSPTFEGTTTTLYGSRTLFFLTPNGTLRPLAIELTRPPSDGKRLWKQVYTTECRLWRLAKAHVLAHDSGYHQLVSHWLRTHCCTEPYIIAANRQLSAMHPIYRLLNPHFRYTMKINALARQFLINAGGIIEYSFSPGKYSMEISSAAYKQWRFDQEALPKDLIKRGLAVEDPSAPHGLKLTIEDNPFANDGLDLWDTIKQWVTDYVNHYYPNPSLVHSDEELQTWWSEIRNVGHGDKKDEPWWPVLETPEDLIEIITTIVWVASGHHAAVNFGQYTYAGYFPNRPSIARINMPDENLSGENGNSLEKPEAVLLKSFPSKTQATIVMAVLDVLSTHSWDEEYLGDKAKPSWKDDPVINAAFERFNGRLKKFEGIVDERNANTHLKNRNGARIVPYELLKPFSQSGVTGKGVPYSISI